MKKSSAPSFLPFFIFIPHSAFPLPYLKMIRLLNSAMMPAEGVYRLRRLSALDFSRQVYLAHEAQSLVSYIGYQQTADFVSRLAGVPVAVSRQPTPVASGDELLIVRLRYRPEAPTRGQPVREEDFEFFHCHYTSS
jgi:hypothetical protein